MEHLNKNGNGKHLPLEVVPDGYKVAKDVLGMNKCVSGFGYRPLKSLLWERPKGSEATERVFITVGWGTSQDDRKEEPMKIALDVPVGFWKEGELLIINLEHLIP